MVERAWDILVSVLMLVAMFFLTPFGGFMVEHIWNPFVASFSAKTFWLILVFVVLMVLAILPVVRYMDRIRHSRIGGKVIDFIKGMINGVKAAFKMKHGLLFVVYTVLVQLLYWLEVVFVIHAFPAVSHLTGMDALFIMMLGLVGWAIPVQGGFGAYHVIVSMALVPIYGIDQQTALVFATISHEAQIVQMIVIGLAALALSVWFRNRRQNKKR
jgi:hypothetical protein